MRGEVKIRTIDGLEVKTSNTIINAGLVKLFSRLVYIDTNPGSLIGALVISDGEGSLNPGVNSLQITDLASSFSSGKIKIVATVNYDSPFNGYTIKALALMCIGLPPVYFSLCSLDPLEWIPKTESNVVTIEWSIIAYE